MNRRGTPKKPILFSEAELRARAEARLQKLGKHEGRKAGDSTRTSDSDRLLHELQVHQIELEMQNSELLESRSKLEALLGKYTDLYDFAPVGYMSLDENGRIIEVNLMGAALLGVERSHLINQRLSVFVSRANRSDFLSFLAQIFLSAGKHVCETSLLRQGGPTFNANIYGAAAISDNTHRNWCRVVISDNTALMESEKARRRLEALAEANQELRLEVTRRREVEARLKKSEHHQKELLAQARVLQDQLRHLSRQLLQAQEEERRRISRELHDIIAQTLMGINVHLAALAKESALTPKSFARSIARTQRLVENSVEIVHQFARELRPPVLDDLGLIPALHSFIKNFAAQTGIRARLTASAAVELLDTVRRAVLFRVAQEALSNVARHSKASRVEVSIQKLPDCICMEIADDGKSFRVESVLQAKAGKRLGLLGIRERLEMVGGSSYIESRPGAGTTIRAQVPFQAASAVDKLGNQSRTSRHGN